MSDDKAAARAATMAKLTDTAALNGASREIPEPLEIQAQKIAGQIRLAGWMVTDFAIASNGVTLAFTHPDGRRIDTLITEATIANETPEQIAARLLKDAT
mgnify:CR=1 FL=1